MFKPSVAAVLVAACCFSAVAEENIEHISIYANRTATPERDVLASITVLERQDIVARQATDLPSLLAQLPGINLARNGGRGQLSSVFVRGGNSGHTLVLIDGVRAGSATSGAASLAMIPLELIERIEVVRGPRAALYGSDAVAGVIAITTRRSDRVEVNINSGSYGQVGADVSAAYSSEQLKLRATAGINRADGINVMENADPDRDGYRQRFAKLAADYLTAVGTLSAEVNVTSGFYQYDNQWGTEDEADTLNRSYLLRWEHQLGSWQHQAQLSRILDRDVSYGPDSRSPFQTERDEFSYQTNTALTENLGVLAGVNWYQEQIDAVTVYAEDSRNNKAVFAGLNYEQDKLKFDAAVRRDDDSQFGGANTWQLAAGYQFTDNLLLRLGRGSSFKAPSFNDLYYPFSENPDLRPERAVEDEIALQFIHSNLQLGLTWFKRDVIDLLQWGDGKMENIAAADIEGLEATAELTVQKFRHSFSYNWLDARDKATDTRLVRRSENTLHWRSTYEAESWSAFVTADYQSKTQQGAFAVTPVLGGFTLWGAGVQHQVSERLSVRVKVDNLTDKEYQTIAGYYSYGTTFGLSLAYTL
ncbi:TonB-dependent receptor [Chromatiaceae bacterium AAb-1]|nr:TonB-dependent receptor [Chromatiaceae bacterium AAb-1]